MSIVNIYPGNLETFTIVARPNVEFISSSAGDITGSATIAARPSKSVKDIFPPGAHEKSEVSDEDFKIDEALSSVKTAFGAGTNITDELVDYMSIVNSESQAARNTKDLKITRFMPPFQYELNTAVKDNVINHMMRFHRGVYTNSQLSYHNYHCLNFFTASTVPSDTCLIYPNIGTPTGLGPYLSTGAWGFDFWIKPPYTNETDGISTAHFRAGTVLHLSSTFAISLVTGSEKDEKGLANSFRILVQLSHSADFAPSQFEIISTGTYPVYGGVESNYKKYPYDLAYVSPDNSLKRNHWHHVSINWGGASYNNGTGSIIVDNDVTTFCIPSESITQTTFNGLGTQDSLFVGNFFEGKNAGSSATSNFFNTTTAKKLGVISTVADTEPYGYNLNHPLNAEVHDIKIYNKARTLEMAQSSSADGPTNMKDMLFYLPPFFTKESPHREVAITPFQNMMTTTDDPFNISYAFGVGGHDINLENYCREFVNGRWPRLHNLTSSDECLSTGESLTANQYLYATASVVKRNLTILPNDNGLHRPNFGMLLSGTYSKVPDSGSMLEKFKNVLGHSDLTQVSLIDLVPTASLYPGLIATGTLESDLGGSTPENPGVAPGSVLTIFQRTRDNTSNEIVLFDISNLYYGNQIYPESFRVVDSNITGSGGKISISFRDDGYGGLYRADALTKHAKWANMGNLFYNEGMAIIKTPVVPLFGEDQYKINLRGQHTIHTLTVNVPCQAGMHNSSSNPVYKKIPADLNANTFESPYFVYITTVNLHDDNLNVVMKTNLAQPVSKKNDDELLFKIKMDF